MRRKIILETTKNIWNMLNKRLLPEDFEMSRYGINARLVQVEDSEFIVRLRTDSSLSKYLHATDSDVNKQKDWIQEYKKRENSGKDYYFLFSWGDKKLGVSRIYNIDGTKATGGSWVCDPTNLMEYTIATLLLARDIFFEVLEFPVEEFQVSKGNNQVLKLHQRMGAEIVEEKEDEYELILKKNNYLKGREKLIKLLRL